MLSTKPGKLIIPATGGDRNESSGVCGTDRTRQVTASLAERRPDVDPTSRRGSDRLRASCNFEQCAVICQERTEQKQITKSREPVAASMCCLT